MQREVTAKSVSGQAVLEPMQLEFVDGEGSSTPLEAEFEYDPTDPFAVSILFKGEPVPVRWTFARDLLVEGYYEPTGDGDVHVWPCLSAQGSAVVIIELSSPAGEVLLQVSSRALTGFVERMLHSVPLGRESELVDVDAALAAVFAD
jgi:hypothetical protein